MDSIYARGYVEDKIGFFFLLKLQIALGLVELIAFVGHEKKRQHVENQDLGGEDALGEAEENRQADAEGDE